MAAEIPLYEVLDGLGGAWATYTRSKDGRSIHRVKSPLLPVRDTKIEALRDLAEWLSDKMGTSDLRKLDALGPQLRRVMLEKAAELERLRREADRGG